MNSFFELEFGLYSKNKWPLVASVFKFEPYKFDFPTPSSFSIGSQSNVCLYAYYTGSTVPISQIYPVYWNNPFIKSRGWTSQAQLELGLDFTLIDMHQIGKQNISLASLIATNNFQPVAKITQYRPLTPSVPPFPVTQATIGHSKATHAPIHYPETIYKSPKLPSTPYLINFKLVYYNPGWMGVWVGMGVAVLVLNWTCRLELIFPFIHSKFKKSNI